MDQLLHTPKRSNKIQQNQWVSPGAGRCIVASKPVRGGVSERSLTSILADTISAITRPEAPRIGALRQWHRGDYQIDHQPGEPGRRFGFEAGEPWRQAKPIQRHTPPRRAQQCARSPPCQAGSAPGSASYVRPLARGQPRPVGRALLVRLDARPFGRAIVRCRTRASGRPGTPS